MAACAHRPEAGSMFVPCFRRVLIDGKVESFTCVCAAEVAEELDENRKARVPDSAREAS